jgi:outer membrane protein OmpA-like peptidoglycan-associated protein
MKLRSLLLAGTVLPLALTLPAAAQQLPPAPSGWVLAQAEQACPEGQECPPPAEQPPAEQAPPEQPPAEPPAEEQAAPPPPEQPVEQQAAPEEPPAEPPAEEQAAPPPPEQPAEQQAAPEEPPAEPPAEEQAAPPPPEQPVEQQAAPEEPPAEPPAEEQAAPPPPEQPAEQQAAPEEPPAEEQQAEPEQPLPQDAIERARRRQQELQQGGEPEQAEQPSEQDQQQAAPEQPPAEQPAEAAAPVEEETVVEEQLEAQGDEQEAQQVRTLRQRLFEQFQQAEEERGPDEEAEEDQQASQEEEEDEDGQDRRRRRGDRDRDDDRDFGGWDHWWEEDRDRVVEHRDNRIIIDLGGGNIYVETLVPEEADRLLYGARDVEVQNLRGGRTRTIVYRENGVQIITVRDRYGNMLTRVKRYPNGHEVVLFDNRFPEDYAGGPPPILIDVPPPVITIPPEQYIVDLGEASPRDIRQALLAPPVQEVQRPYTLQEVLHNEEVRAYSPRIDLDTITFEFGSATIGQDQMPALLALGQAMEDVLAENPDEVYLVEGHTDAVGSDTDNLILSDKRAEAVAVALSQNFDIPPENLVTEGYGEQFLKVDTLAAERQNRRATVRRLTELLAQQQ